MGIFKEDLINFGNLINTEIEVKLTPEDFNRVFPGLEFEFSDRLLRIKGKKRSLLIRRGIEFRGRQDENKVYNIRGYKTEDMGLCLEVLTPNEAKELTEREGFSEEEGCLRISILSVLKGKDLYKKIPDTFKDRLLIKRYKIGEGYLTVYLTVTK